MPYKSKSDLPESVRDALPAHAEEIYQAAYNNAYEEYGHDEARAHRVAWGAVEKKYHKDEKTGEWKEGASREPK